MLLHVFFAATEVKLIYPVLKKLIQEMQNSYCIRKKFWKTKIFILDFHVMQFCFKFRSKRLINYWTMHLMQVFPGICYWKHAYMSLKISASGDYID